MLEYLFGLLGFGVLCWIAWIVIRDVGEIASSVHDLTARSERMEKTLEIIRAQPEQEKWRQYFAQADNLTLKEMRLLKKGNKIGLIVENISDPVYRFRSFEYVHDHVDEETEVFLKGEPNSVARTTHGFCPKHEAEEIDSFGLPPEAFWAPYKLLVGENRSQTLKGEWVKCWYRG